MVWPFPLFPDQWEIIRECDFWQSVQPFPNTPLGRKRAKTWVRMLMPRCVYPFFLVSELQWSSYQTSLCTLSSLVKTNPAWMKGTQQTVSNFTAVQCLWTGLVWLALVVHGRNNSSLLWILIRVNRKLRFNLLWKEAVNVNITAEWQRLITNNISPSLCRLDSVARSLCQSNAPMPRNIGS